MALTYNSQNAKTPKWCGAYTPPPTTPSKGRSPHQQSVPWLWRETFQNFFTASQAEKIEREQQNTGDSPSHCMESTEFGGLPSEILRAQVHKRLSHTRDRICQVSTLPHCSIYSALSITGAQTFLFLLTSRPNRKSQNKTKHTTASTEDAAT